MPHRIRQLLAMAPGAALLLAGVLADLRTSTATRAALCRAIICGAGLVAVCGGYQLSRPGRRFNKKHVLFALVCCLLVYGAAEIICSVGAWASSQRLKSFWIFEDSDRTVEFDPIRGYRLTQTPSRYARVTNGELEFVGTLRGNAQGYPDADDFTVAKPVGVEKRFLVFGDSFSAAQFVEQNWPDFVEDEVQDRWQLYNFSTDGGGLANWWSNYTRVVEPEHYEFDTVIFAVFQGDLLRGFCFAEHRGYQRHMLTRSSNANPDAWPKSLEEARPQLGPIGGSFIVHPDEFAIAIDTKRLSRSETPPTLFHRLWLTSNTYNACKTIGEALLAQPAPRPPQTQDQQELMLDLKRRFAERQVNVIVVHVPSRDELLGYDMQSATEGRREARAFADLLDAKFVDGAGAFQGLTPHEIRKHWLPYDGHWGQLGSNRFGKFMIEVLQRE